MHFRFYCSSFVDAGLQELGILPVDDEDANAPLKQAVVMFFSFIGFGIIPLFG